jgi:hypothetical protein
MANSLSSLTAGVGGVQISSVDTSGSLDIKSGTTTIVSITSAGAAVTGTLSSTSGTTIQGITVGKGGGAVATNTAVGVSALAANTTASDNTAVGYQAGYSNTTGIRNTASGYQSLYTSSIGNYNTAMGWKALNLSTGDSNTGLGYTALLNTSTGTNNTAIGESPLQSNTTGSFNTAVGVASLKSNTTASYNTAVGYQAGYSFNTTSNTYNCFIGDRAGYSATTGTANTYVGAGGSGYYMTTGSKNTILGAYNGNQGGLDIRTASNIIVLSDGDGNPVFVYGAAPSGAGAYGMTGGYATLGIGGTSTSDYTGSLGLNASSGANRGPTTEGYANGSNVWSVGSYARIKQAGSTSQLLTCINTSGGVYLATASATAWSSASDERVKENLIEITDAASKVSTLRAVTGNYIWDDVSIRKPFLIAQDVQAVLPEAVSTIDNENGEQLNLAYTEIIPLLVAAIKELKAEIDLLKGVK